MDDLLLMFFDSVLAFDNVTHKVHVMGNVHTAGDLAANYAEAVERSTRSSRHWRSRLTRP